MSLRDATEVIPREEQSHSRLKILAFFRVPICQASKTTEMHTQTQIEPFGMRRADMCGIGPFVNDLGYNLRDSWWGVPPFGSVKLPVIAEQFDKLGEVRLPRKYDLDRTVKMVSVIGFSPLALGGKSRKMGLGLECGLPRVLG